MGNDFVKNEHGAISGLFAPHDLAMALFPAVRMNLHPSRDSSSRNAIDPTRELHTVIDVAEQHLSIKQVGMKPVKQIILSTYTA